MIAFVPVSLLIGTYILSFVDMQMAFSMYILRFMAQVPVACMNTLF